MAGEEYQEHGHFFDEQPGVDARYCKNPDRGTIAHFISTGDLVRVEAAVGTLLQHRVIGVNWKIPSEDPIHHRRYSPIRLLVLSGGDETFIFDIATAGELPTSIRLLLTHQDFVKIVDGDADVEQVLGMFWRDFGFFPRQVYDVHSNIAKKYTPTFTLYQAFRRLFNNATFSEDHYQLSLSPSRNEIDDRTKMRRHAFISWATREVWLLLASPKGYPPNLRCIGKPVDVCGLAAALSCSQCDARLHSQSALRQHIKDAHSFPCPVCPFLCHSAEELASHLAARHVRCPDCGDWCADAVALNAHNRRVHDFVCPCNCGARFSNDEALTKHCRHHHHQCDICHKWFVDQDKLELHKDMNHPMCHFCGRLFTSEKALAKHRYARVNGICLKTGTGEHRKHHSNTTSLSKSSNLSSSVAHDHVLAREIGAVDQRDHGTLNQSLPPSDHRSWVGGRNKRSDQQRMYHENHENASANHNARIHIHVQDEAYASDNTVSFPTNTNRGSAQRTHTYAQHQRPVHAGHAHRIQEQNSSDQRNRQQASQVDRDGPDNIPTETDYSQFESSVLDTSVLSTSHSLHTPRRGNRRSVRWYDPPKTPEGPLEISRFADHVGEIPR
eukprot:m.934954 g.934954  ORF g.934954 m.934954 type:complete len:611 (-) comp23802_c0_seq3:1955-3787(-)